MAYMYEGEPSLISGMSEQMIAANEIPESKGTLESQAAADEAAEISRQEVFVSDMTGEIPLSRTPLNGPVVTKEIPPKDLAKIKAKVRQMVLREEVKAGTLVGAATQLADGIGQRGRDT
jgi:hypothetical protein